MNLIKTCQLFPEPHCSHLFNTAPNRSSQIHSIQLNSNLIFSLPQKNRNQHDNKNNSQHPRSIQIKSIPFRSNLRLSRLFCSGYSNLRLPKDGKENLEINMVTNQYRTELLNSLQIRLLSSAQVKSFQPRTALHNPRQVYSIPILRGGERFEI